MAAEWRPRTLVVDGRPPRVRTRTQVRQERRALAHSHIHVYNTDRRTYMNTRTDGCTRTWCVVEEERHDRVCSLQRVGQERLPQWVALKSERFDMAQRAQLKRQHLRPDARQRRYLAP